MRLCGFSQACPGRGADWIAPVTPGPVVGLRAALLVTLPAGVVAAVAGALVAGSAAAWGVVAGTALLVGFFGFGLLTMHLVSALAPALSLLVALLTYTVQVALLALVFVALRDSGLMEGTVDRRWLGLTVIVGTLAWTGLLLRGATTQRIPHYHTPADLAKPRNEGSAERPDAG